jgi:restriction endonuclease S subunit
MKSESYSNTFFERTPLKRYLKVRSGDMISYEEETQEGYPIIGGNGLRAYTSRYNINGPSLVIGRVGANCGNVHLIEGQFWASEHAFVVIPRKQFDLKFAEYMIGSLNLNSRAIRTAQPLLNSTIVEETLGYFPPLKQQQQIAKYLDEKIAEIDTIIQVKADFLTRLSEKSQALITAAVTHGLNPNIKLKDSEIDWLGEVPEHWEVKKLKYAVNKIDELVDESNFVIAVENIESKTGKLVDLDKENNYQGALFGFEVNDVIFNKLRPYLAKVYMAEKNGACIGELLILRAKQQLYPRFLFYRLLSSDFISEVDSSTIGAKMPRANWDDFIKDLKIAIPPYQEQVYIVEKLDKELKKIVVLIDLTQQSICLLKEHRTALISASITGQLEIPEL